MGSHAILSPSASERWLECPASVRMEGLVPPEAESVYAREGTCAHGLAEIKASLEFGVITKREATAKRRAWEKEFVDILGAEEFEIDEMERHTDAYVDLVKERVAEHPNSSVRFEQKMDSGVPSCWGTSDTVIVSPIHVEIIDFKYGQGVEVQAIGNPQLRLYACGALDAFGDVLGETEEVTMTVHQPRLFHVLSETLTADELRAWRTDYVIPRAALALSDDAPFGPSDVACRWCPAAGRCKAQLEAVFATDFEQEAEDLSPEDMAEIQPKIKMIRDWLNAFEAAALDMAYSQGQKIPGYKVIRSGGQRKIFDPAGAIDLLVGKGHPREDVVVEKIRGIGELEKLLGVSEFADLCKPFISKSEGKPALVPDTDSRPAIEPNSEAASDFNKADLL